VRIVARQFYRQYCCVARSLTRTRWWLRQFRADVFVGFRVFEDGADVYAAFVRKGALPDERSASWNRQIR